ncbi:MAG TPA: ATP-binding protein, partial [Acidimicrobiales bacterium]|nr:ATP-binding protein [Acidimicrobiales bacterium]
LWDSSARSLPVPANMSHGVSVFELDKARSMIVAASANSPHKPGIVPAKSWLRSPLGDATARKDADGVERIYQEVHMDGTGAWVLAAIPKSVAMAEPRAELRNNLIVGAAVVLLVIVLGFLMQRRIARPIKTLKDVIVASAEDHIVNAVPEGPAEVAAVARAFNTTMHERRELESDLADALKQAQRASQLKSEFLANMSHEIRTPMNGVLGMLSLLEDAEVTSDVRDCLVTMSDSATSLMAILNELLDFSKLEAGMMSAERAEFSLREVLRSAVSPWVGIAGRKSVPLVATVDQDVPDELIGDPTRVRQILSNLIDNAVKFTTRGRITVTATKRPGDVVRFAVADSGIGITEEARAHLFEPFVQADGSTTRRFGGTGLGLAICKQLAEFMGGTIGVDSVFGEGSTFWFELPLPVARGLAEDETVVEEDEAPGPALVDDACGLRVLVVDDNLVNQKVAVQMLRKLGYEVSVAGDGVAALRAIDAGVFDIVLMDVQMPVMDGWEATTELRRRGRTIPIVAMTASALEEDRKRCAAVGMDGYVVKPMNLDALHGEITRVLAHLAETEPAVSA